MEHDMDEQARDLMKDDHTLSTMSATSLASTGSYAIDHPVPSIGSAHPSLAAVADEVRRLSGDEARAFLRDRVIPLKPVILTDIMQDVPALRKWTPAFFRDNYGGWTKEVKGRSVSMSQQIEHIFSSSEEQPAPYPFNVAIEEEMPALMDDLRPFISFGRTDRTTHPWMPRFLLRGTIVHELFFGGQGASYPWLHYDLLGMHTQMTQILGEKEFIFYDPSQTLWLYPTEDNPRLSRVDNVFDPDLRRFPLFRHARQLRVVLKEGETLFFPRGWWHVTRMTGPSISYGRAVLNASNWGPMLWENFKYWSRAHPLKALPGLAAGAVVGSGFAAMEALRLK